MMATSAWCRSRRGRADFGFHHQRHRAIHQASAIEWSQSQDGGGCHAAGTTNKSCAAQFLAMQFRQAIDALRQQVWRAMSLAIPVLVERGRTQSEIRRQIDDAWRYGAIAVNFSRRYPMWQAEKQQITRCQIIRMAESQCALFAQIWM